MRFSIHKGVLQFVLATFLCFSGLPKISAYECIWPTSWSSWLGGAILGAGAGGVAGWAAGRTQCRRGCCGRRGKEGKKGEKGPPGPVGFVVNYEDQVSFSFTNLNSDPTLVYTVTLFDPFGAIVFRQEGIDKQTAANPGILIPGKVPKREGQWHAAIEITQDASDITQIGEFVFQVNAKTPQVFIPFLKQYVAFTGPIVYGFDFP